MRVMTDQVEVILTRIEQLLIQQNAQLREIKEVLSEDRKMMWRLLFMVIAGAFLLIGIKLYLPG